MTKPRKDGQGTVQSHAELRLRKLLRELFPKDKPLFNNRPAWLKGCELDIYYPDLNLAYEFNGKQHYEFDPKYHKTEACLESQKERDRFKAAECKQRGIHLVIVRFAHLVDAQTICFLTLGLPVDDNRTWRGPGRRDKSQAPTRKELNKQAKARKKATHTVRLAAWKERQAAEAKR